MEDIFNYCGRTFSLQTLLLVADELIDSIFRLHAAGFVHRDVKPENVCVGAGNAEALRHLYLIDYGLAHKWRHGRTGKHMRLHADNETLGSARFSSPNAHIGLTLSRRDDMISLAYMLVYFANGGSLPWSGAHRTHTDCTNAIADHKLSVRPLALCGQMQPHLVHGLRPLMIGWLEHACALRFAEKPNYATLQRLVRDAYARAHLLPDGQLDWINDGQLEMRTRQYGLEHCKPLVRRLDNQSLTAAEADEMEASNRKTITSSSTDSDSTERARRPLRVPATS